MIKKNEHIITGGVENTEISNKTYNLKFHEMNNFKIIQKSNLLTGRISHSSIFIGDNLYILGGFNGTESLNSVEKYSIKNNTYKFVEPMKKKRKQFSCSKINNKYILCFGGKKDSFLYENTVEK